MLGTGPATHGRAVAAQAMGLATEPWSNGGQPYAGPATAPPHDRRGPAPQAPQHVIHNQVRFKNKKNTLNLADTGLGAGSASHGSSPLRKRWAWQLGAEASVAKLRSCPPAASQPDILGPAPQAPAAFRSSSLGTGPASLGWPAAHVRCWA